MSPDPFMEEDDHNIDPVGAASTNDHDDEDSDEIHSIFLASIVDKLCAHCVVEHTNGWKSVTIELLLNRSPTVIKCHNSTTNQDCGAKFLKTLY